MKKILIIIVLMSLIACVSIAGEQQTWTVTTGTNAAAAVTNFANPFIGEIDEIAVYTSAGTTGTVAIAAIDPYSSTALVLATNTAVTSYMIWAPRIVPPDVGGATSLSVTNGSASTAERYFALGESIRAVVTGANKTGQTFRVRLKVK